MLNFKEFNSNVFDQEGFSQIALITMIKNEEDIIFENLVWHFSIGFRKFVIVDNLSSDQTVKKIKEFRELTKNFTKVFIIEDPIFEYIQGRIVTGAYNFARSIWPEVTWIFPVDADEFWTPTRPLKEIFTNLPQKLDIIKSLSVRYHPTEDYYNFASNAKFYEKLHYHSKYHISDNPDTHRDKIVLKAKNCFKIDQGNHGIQWMSDCDQDVEINTIEGKFIGLNLVEFQLRSVQHTHSKFFNGMEANLQAQKSGMIPKGAGVHWSKYKEYLELYNDKAAEIKFNQSFADLENVIDDPFPIARSMDMFYAMVQPTEIRREIVALGGEEGLVENFGYGLI